ncbi:ATP-binding protein [Streptomyces sp. NRRL S-495]|uniref:ATP-binding protein n=1 Tax=Streptomyces sp. NRRL S-495 TaxID=1609133 RepID=UPI0013319E33|nr:ATP-binding protein [Streptomyces sp. NRRL S-495]
MDAENRQALRQWDMDFTAYLQSVGLARGEVRRILREWGWEGDGVDDVVAICSELVANAIVHACAEGDRVRVHLQEIGGDCRLEVSDPRGDLLLREIHPGLGTSGRGIAMVRQFADDFGVAGLQGKGRGKRVWARRKLTPAEPGAGAAA